MRNKLASWIKPETPLEQAVVKDRDAWQAEDVLELVNSKLEKVDVKIPEQKEYLSSAHRIWSEPAFAVVIDKLIQAQIDHSVLIAESWERVLFDRATINGMNLIKEEFEELNNQFNLMVEPPKKFNKHDIL